MKKPTICIFSAFLKPHLGGVERYVEQMAQYLGKINCSVIVVTSNSNGLDDTEKTEFCSIIRLPVFKAFNSRFPIPKPLPKFFKLLSELHKLQSDVYIINMRFYLISLIGAIFSIISKKPLVYIEHLSGHIHLHNPILDISMKLYERLTAIIMRLFAERIYGVSSLCVDWLRSFHLKTNGVIYNGVPTSRLSASDNSIKVKFNIAINDLIIVYAGRLIEEKGLLFLIDAFRGVTEIFSNVHLFIVGSGNLFTVLCYTAEANNKIHITGYMKHEDVTNLLEISDIVVYPSHYPEGLPSFLLEAGITRNAVVSTNAGGIGELIIDEKTGLVVPAKSSIHIKSALLKLLKNPELKRILADNLFEHVRKNFDINPIMSNFSKDIFSLIPDYSKEKK